jgi:stage II sporulation protein D
MKLRIPAVSARPARLAVCVVAAALAAVVAVGAEPLRLSPPAPAVSDRLPLDAGLQPPVVRIGLSTASDRVTLDATKGALRVLDARTGQPVWPGRSPGRVLVVSEGGRTDEARRVFRVQVGSFADEPNARELAAELEAELRAPASVKWDPSRGVFRVRIGRAASREALQGLLAAARAAGHADAWIASELAGVASAGALKLVDARWNSHDTGTDTLLFLAGEGGRVSVDGRPYRGFVEVRRTPLGTLQAINEIGLENYLRGVVPEELGPAAWPQLEALKAQTIAARTYILGNLGQYAEEGFDICDTPRCQVYGGAASEHPLSDRAIRETRGEVLVYEQRPINAMYTSTCGGHTEDLEVVFPEMEGPYLRAVSCVPDEEFLARRSVRVRGAEVAAAPAGADDHDAAPLRLGRMVVHGLAPRDAFDPAWRALPVTADEAAAWIGALARAAGLPAPARVPDPPRRLDLWRAWWGEALSLGDAGGLVHQGESAPILTLVDRRAIPPDERELVAELLARGMIRPGSDGRLRPLETPSRGELLDWLGRAGEIYDVVPLREATVLGLLGDSLRLEERRSARGWRLGRPRPDLFAGIDGGWHRIDEVVLAPGDKVLFAADAAGQLRLLAVPERKGIADDRYSARYRWTEVRERRELERSLAEVAPVGRLRDLEVLERGRSGRVARLRIVGTRGTAVVEGFRLRRALGLLETQFEMEIQREPGGLVRRVVFRGRGWGHGVGLCQVGAYGMALRGASYREILQHYYTGVRLMRASFPRR